jgi:hypothetical protein
MAFMSADPISFHNWSKQLGTEITPAIKARTGGVIFFKSISYRRPNSFRKSRINYQRKKSLPWISAEKIDSGLPRVHDRRVHADCALVYEFRSISGKARSARFASRIGN